MDPATRERLTTLFYILARDHLPWGTLHKVIDEHVRATDGERVYCSDAGRALADAAIDRLLGPARDHVASNKPTVTGKPIDKGSRVFVKPECPASSVARPGHAGIVVRIDIRGFVAVRHDAPSDELVYDINHLVPVKDLVGRTFQHHDGATCTLIDIHTDVCGVQWPGDGYENGIGVTTFTNGDFVLLPEQSTAESPSTGCDSSADTPSTSDHEVIAARLRRALLEVAGVTEVYVKLDNSIADDWKARVTVTGGNDTEVALAIASALPVWFNLVGDVHVRAQVPTVDGLLAFTNVDFDRPAQHVPEPTTEAIAEPQTTKQGLLRRLNTALDWSIRSTFFVFTSDASTAGMVRKRVESRLGPALCGDHDQVEQEIRADAHLHYTMGITLDLSLIHRLTPGVISLLAAAAEDAARSRSCPLVIIADPEHRAELMRTNAWEVRTAVFDFDAATVD